MMLLFSFYTPHYMQQQLESATLCVVVQLMVINDALLISLDGAGVQV